MSSAAEAFGRFASKCPYRRALPMIQRGVNALNVEVLQPLARCVLKPPQAWPEGMALRWLGSGGDHTPFGRCSQHCALGHRWCQGCGHRMENHADGGCLVDGACLCRGFAVEDAQ